MDPFTIATGSLQLAKLAGSTALALQTSWNRYTEAEEHVHGLIALLQSLKVSSNRLSNHSRTRLNGDLKAALDGSLKACATLVRDMDKKISAVQREDGIMGVLGRARFVWTETDIIRLEERLDRQINALNHVLITVLSAGDEPDEVIGSPRRGAAPVLRQAMDDAATYARDEDFDILSQDGSTMTPASTATIESGSSGTLVPIDHRPWAKGAAQASRESVASRSSFMSFFRKRKNTGPSDKQVQTAFKNSDVATIHLWLEAGGSANAPLKLDSKRALPLEWASKAWSVNGGERNSQVIKVIEMLIEYGADVNRGYDCFWPFWFAVMMDGNGSGELIQCFIDHGADVHRDYDPGLFDYANGFLPNDWETGSLPITMLEGACRQGLATAVLLLIRAGANINAMAASESNKPMHRLACCANPANHDFHVWDTLIKEFIRAGADVNAQNRLAKTPLCFAVSPRRGRNLDMVKALVMNGASWQHRDFEGKSMFHYLTDEDNTYEWLVPRGKGFTFCSWLTCSQSIPLARPLRRPHNSRPQ